MTLTQPAVIAVVGPTGAGKTALALSLAKRNLGILLSADSRQVYRGLDIGTNKEGTTGEWQNITCRYLDDTPQLLIDIADPGSRFTLHDWLEAAKQALIVIEREQKLAIIVGGTGLYVTALINNWQPPTDDPAKRQALEQLSLSQLQQSASTFDLNNSERNNRQRLIRILERGHRLTSAAARPSLILELNPPRNLLFERSDERFERIWPELVQETERLLSQGVPSGWLETIGLDYRFASRFINGQLSRQEAIAHFNQASHRYIRRQQTWWRGHGPTTTVDSIDQADQALKQFLEKEPQN